MRYLKVKRHRAFTLIELLVVIAIIGILATMTTLYFYQAKARANYSRVVADMTEIGKAVKVYAVQNNNIYPFDVANDTVPSGLESYFNNSTFPKTPCKSGDYKYDYQNWLVDDCEDNSNNSTPADYVVGINYMKTGDTNNYIYFFDVKNFANHCSADKAGSEATQNGGTNIFDVSAKEITCKE